MPFVFVSFVNTARQSVSRVISQLRVPKRGKYSGLESSEILIYTFSKKIINEILRRFDARPELKDTLVISLISKAKAKGWSPEDLALRASRNHERSLNGYSVPHSEKELAEIAPIYEEYLRYRSYLRAFTDAIIDTWQT
jgi:superfamily I DNA/RNA helicase